MSELERALEMVGLQLPLKKKKRKKTQARPTHTAVSSEYHTAELEPRSFHSLASHPLLYTPTYSNLVKP